MKPHSRFEITRKILIFWRLFIGIGAVSGHPVGGILGGTLMAWITIQCIIFPLNFMSTACFVFGLL